MADCDMMEAPKLSDLFDKIWTIYTFIDKTDKPTVSSVVQDKVHCGIAACERAVIQVNQLSIFSSNEDIEEVATAEIRYLLLPAFLGYFTGIVTSGEVVTSGGVKQPVSRIDIVKKSKVYYEDFLRLCHTYGVTQVNVDDDETPATNHCARSASIDLEAMSREREVKLLRFREQKETEVRLNELYEHVKRQHVDDSTRREYYQTLLERWIQMSRDSLDSIEMEMPILEHMAKMKLSSGSKSSACSKTGATKQKSPSTFRPFIITKDQLQKAVYGAGYPSLPVLSVDEFYEQQVRDGLFPPPGQTQRGVNGDGMPTEEDDEREAATKEGLEEGEDLETLTKARDWDDWKDDHRRGWGNTKNQG